MSAQKGGYEKVLTTSFHSLSTLKRSEVYGQISGR